MSNLDYRYEKTANDLIRRMLREYRETDWTVDNLYSLVKRIGEIDASKYKLFKNGPDDIINIEGPGGKK